MNHDTVWINCQAGIAGDMLLGALVDAGADIAAVAAILQGLGLPDWALRTDRVDRAGITATHAIVVVHHHDSEGHNGHHHRCHRDIVEIGRAHV